MTERIDVLGRVRGRDYTGLTSGTFQTLGPVQPIADDHPTRWRIRCTVCGTTRDVRTDRLGSGVKGCFCANARYTRPHGRHNLHGLVVGDLTVIEPAFNIESTTRSAPRMGYTAWKCACRCGRRVVVKTKQLVAQIHPTTHCGCRRQLPAAPMPKPRAPEP